MQTNTIINKLVETINTGDNTLYNIDELMLVYDFLFKSDWPERTLNRILDYYKSPLMYEEVISKLENKYSKRNFALLLSELYQEQNNLEGIKNIIDTVLKEEFDFLGYRELVFYYANNYSEKDFFDAFAKINRREMLMPRDYNAIKLFIEKYSAKNGLEVAKKMCLKLKMDKLVKPVIPIILGQSFNLSLVELEKTIKNEVEEMETQVRVHEDVFTKLYERTADKSLQLDILDLMLNYAELIPKDLKVKGYPSKFWTLYLWRLGQKYLAHDKKEKVEEIIKKLTGNNKKSLKESYNFKYKNS
jgi:hypothetical protein